QRCHSAVEAARPALVAIDPELATMQVMLHQGVSADAPPVPGPKRLSLIAAPCVGGGCARYDGAGDSHSVATDRVYRATEARWVSLLLEGGEPDRRARLLALLRPIVELCLGE